ncbi:HAD-IA family hydrolase [Aureimonas phyllosphaerae]|uniref:Phosphoglycolate phosphatase n=1 Tax=Aureimonas phyllosphaerae TaxID=1166078 RepID=A0A7W6FT49_9HYPH|nr:HAD-IA family hydrolase [Aureimonas phyllosphaerae]MBB3934799.1 phosphoglycolate phosphatase [Aureimonas phyllosphaerae]MBB3957986.1 phosphoglycolate phosphatase [Aureimonas phyllosphaerae]SFF43509.1 phosphoglycolate phosphatase [Aureimonas phyllosphaerae]
MRAILFDCDGTLADSFGLICETMRRCFEKAGLPEPDDAATRGIIGLSLDLAIHRLAPTVAPRDLPALVDTYRDAFHEIRAEGTYPERLFPGIEPMLRRLAQRDDVLLGMVTGKSRRGVSYVVEAHDLHGMFAAVRTADDCPSKPHPAMVTECCDLLGMRPQDTLVVGDAVYDMQMAVAAGAVGWGVAWGAQSAETLISAGARGVAQTVGELEAALAAWSMPEPSRVVGA